MDLSKYDRDTKQIHLSGNQITEINWEGCPQSLQKIYLYGNQIQEINWENCPQGLQEINLSYNEITKITWENCPQNLQEIYLSYNQITEINCENCPQSLQEICLCGNQITEINWEGAPLYLDVCEPFTEKLQEYRKSMNFVKNLTKTLQPVHNELISKTLTPFNDKPCHNVKGFKQRFLDWQKEAKKLLN